MKLKKNVIENTYRFSVKVGGVWQEEPVEITAESEHVATHKLLRSSEVEDCILLGRKICD